MNDREGVALSTGSESAGKAAADTAAAAGKAAADTVAADMGEDHSTAAEAMKVAAAGAGASGVDHTKTSFAEWVATLLIP